MKNTDMTTAPLATPRSRGRQLTATALRVLLGLILVANAPIGSLIPLSKLGPTTGPAYELMAALWGSPYIMVLAKLTELSVGLLLLSNRFVPLALTLFAPVLLNIVLYQGFYAPGFLPMGFFMLATTLFLAWEHRDAYRPVLSARPLAR
jgi:hypothetical protein